METQLEVVKAAWTSWPGLVVEQKILPVSPAVHLVAFGICT